MSAPVALVTGASQGIGAALAHEFAGGGYDVVLSARSEERLSRVAKSITERGRAAHVFPADLASPQGAAQLADAIAARGLEVDVLVNNAGFGLAKSFAQTPPEECLAMVDVNIRALSELTRRYLPAMIDRGAGGVLNVGSLAGFVPGPMMATYYSTKHYVLAFSEALYEECRGTGVTVTALCPGGVDTGFIARAGFDRSQLDRTSSLLRAVGVFMPPEQVARAGYRAFVSQKRIIIPGAVNKFSAWAGRALPRWMVLPILARVHAYGAKS